jgi:hypothetical protein
MNTTTTNLNPVTVYETIKKVARVTLITTGTLALLAYVSLLAVVIIL